MQWTCALVALLAFPAPGGASDAPTVTVPWAAASRLARDARLAGTVVLEALVDTTGAVTAVSVARSRPALDDAASARARALRLEPLRSPASGALVTSLQPVTVTFEGPETIDAAELWSQHRCEESTFTIDLDVRPDSTGRFAARWHAKGLKSQELNLVVLVPDGAVLDAAGAGTPQQLAEGDDAPAWPAWHRNGREVRKGTEGTFAVTLPAEPWWNQGRVAVVAVFHDVFDDRVVVRQKAWIVQKDAMGHLLVFDPAASTCAAGPWRHGL